MSFAVCGKSSGSELDASMDGCYTPARVGLCELVADAYGVQCSTATLQKHCFRRSAPEGS
jgi:hypothetical protein